MDSTISYIKISESAAIKGFLIFLIILGHNMIFTHYTEPIQGMGYLYCFHIQAFFILPFLYGAKLLTKKRLANYFIRLYWPYLLLTTILSVIYSNFYLQKGFDFWEILRMYITGDVDLIKQHCGVQIFWFMPAMFSLSVLKDWFYNSNKVVRTVLLLFSCIANVFLFLASDYGYYYEISADIRSVVPFGLYSGISYLVFGVFVRWIVGKLKEFEIKCSSCLIIGFIGCSFLYFINELSFHEQMIHVALLIVMPIIFMLILWYNGRHIQHLSFMEKAGDKTFPMYIIHPFIGYILYAFVVKYIHISLLWAIVAQIVMFWGSYYLSVGLYRVDRIRKILLPRSFSELKSVFK